jgi:putative GTP pyrophosphokinase
MADESEATQEFDFDAHRESAVSQYRIIRPTYDQLAEVAKRLLTATLNSAHIKYHSIEARAKTVDSFGDKAAEPSESNPMKPKYPEPLKQITDMAGIRVITFLPRTVQKVCKHIEQEFDVLKEIDKATELEDELKLGYQSVHFLVKMHPDRAHLSEYRPYSDLILEIQVRTLLQHAWAEMEHDIQYKSTITIPTSIKRRFMALAGLLEIADREFQTLQDEDERLRQQARRSIESGDFTVEITPDTLKSYLDKKLGSDGRMSRWVYEYTANLLRRIGFKTLSQVEECIAGYDDDQVSRILWNTRQGQVSRFEDTLLAAMGTNFITRHPWYTDEGFVARRMERLDRLRNASIPIGAYDPSNH